MGFLKSPIVYIEINSYDIETYLDNSNYIPYCICLKINKKYFSFFLSDQKDNLVEESVSFIFKNTNQKKINIYIHNLNFDGILLISYLSKTKKYKYKAFMKKMSFYNITIEYENRSIIFNCSYKIFPLSLKKIAIDFTNLKKLPFPYEFSSYKNLNYIGDVPEVQYWNNSEDYYEYITKFENFLDFKKYSIEYCLNDVKITHFFLEKLFFVLKNFNIDMSKINSGPSLALKIFIKKFNKSKISFSTSGFYDKLTRCAYYGGRCEVYGNPFSHEKIYHYDVSGMYSQCMKQKYPYGDYEIKLNNINIEKPGYYWIVFDSDLEYPVLPIHREFDNKLMFCNGKNLSGCYWFEEIQFFLENSGGKINKVLYGLEYSSYDYVFNDYVDFFLKMREQGGAYSALGKNMNNFLYGRLGLSEPDEFTFFIPENEIDYYLNWKKYDVKSLYKINNIYVISLEINDYVRKNFNIKNHKFKKNVGIAAAITSKARIKLYKAQQDVICNKGRLLYSDTDSVFAAYENNVINQQHGSVFWDIEKKDTEIQKAVFVNPKTYGLIYKNGVEIVKVKGFNNKNITFDEISTNFYNQTNIEKKIKIIKKKNMSLKFEELNKVLDLTNYDKRIFINNKKQTLPIYTSSHNKYNEI